MQNKNLKFAFFGTPYVASETLEILKQGGFLPSLIVTTPDKPQGRKMIITPSPVKVWAIKNNIPYLQPERLDEDFISKLATYNCELFVVVAYGKILPEKLIFMPKLGTINIHYSLLPKYRGASPVEACLLNGDTETGVTIQKMEFKLDTGPIITQEEVSISSEEKYSELIKRLIKNGADLLVKTLPDYVEGKISLISQKDEDATMCKKIQKEEGEINLNDDPIKNYNKFRAFDEWPRTYFFARQSLGDGGFKDEKRFIITDAKLENGEFVIKRVIPEGGKEIDYKN
ncbi:MAG: methionyl-tRNA formyltransferase [Candidatus Paceibacterota bacterium]|jgi:methionyl-tRNA formyltransferase